MQKQIYTIFHKGSHQEQGSGIRLNVEPLWKDRQLERIIFKLISVENKKQQYIIPVFIDVKKALALAKAVITGTFDNLYSEAFKDWGVSEKRHAKGPSGEVVPEGHEETRAVWIEHDKEQDFYSIVMAVYVGKVREKGERLKQACDPLRIRLSQQEMYELCSCIETFIMSYQASLLFNERKDESSHALEESLPEKNPIREILNPEKEESVEDPKEDDHTKNEEDETDAKSASKENREDPATSARFHKRQRTVFLNGAIEDHIQNDDKVKLFRKNRLRSRQKDDSFDITAIMGDFPQRVTSSKDIANMFRKLKNLNHEELFVVYIAVDGRPVSQRWVPSEKIIAKNKTKYYQQLKFNRRHIFEKIPKKATYVAIVHNHPGQSLPIPSVEDLKATQNIAMDCRKAGLRFYDHIIIGEEGFYSFRENAIRSFIKDETPA